MTTPWRPQIDIIQDGEQVSAAVADRPIGQLANQTQYLKSRLDDQSGNSGALIHSQAPLDPAVQAGDVVYYDWNTQSYRQALAQCVAAAGGQQILAPSSFVSGIVTSKDSTTLGSVLKIGRFSLTDLALDPSVLMENPVLQPFGPGRYFLSNTVPGKITQRVRMPNIQVGFFTSDECTFQPLQKDIFEAHYHYVFPLKAQPASSQNFAQTGWGATAGNVAFVDYFNQGSAATPPAIILCARIAATTPVSAANPVRIELFNDGGQLHIQQVLGAVQATPLVGSLSDVSLSAWPDYGTWIPVTGTNLEVAFIRSDATYANTLAVDAAALLTNTSMRYKLILPNDLSGWTNANPFDLATPSNVLYRYLHEGDQDLANVFPPLPTEGSSLEINGTSLIPGTDFKVTTAGIFWIPGISTGNGFYPWPVDYSAVSAMSAANARSLRFFFSASNFENARSVVYSLEGVAPLVVRDRLSKKPSGNGDLEILVDLNTTVDPADPTDQDSALALVSGVAFERGNVVSQLVAGPGIALTNLSSQKGIFVGKVQVSATNMKFEGEFNDIALRNAKEASNNVASWIDFLPPATPSGLTASFRVPTADLNPANLKLKILGSFKGNTAIISGGSEQYAVFKVVYHVLRPGFNLSAMSDATAVAVQYWTLTFPGGYNAGLILPSEYPLDPANPNAFQIDTTTLAANPASLVALSGGFQPGDLFSIQIDRVASGGGNADTYGGRAGLTGLRWILL